MKEQFVDHEIAILLKEKGYKEECMAYYEISIKAKEDPYDGFSGPFGWKKGEVNFNKGYFENNGLPDNSNEYWLLCGAPLWQQAIDWLREKHNLRIFESTPIAGLSSKSFNKDFRFELVKISGNGTRANSVYGDGGLGSRYQTYPSYNEARQEAIKHALTLI